MLFQRDTSKEFIITRCPITKCGHWKGECKNCPLLSKFFEDRLIIRKVIQ